MPLSDLAIRKAKAGAKIQRIYDRDGLYLEVTPSGGKLWRQKYRFAGKEKRLALGRYPEIRLADARERCRAARKLIANNVDPGVHRKAEKAAGEDRARNSFEVIGREWLAIKAHGCSPLLKYESDGGPGLQAIADTLIHSRNAEQDLETLIVSQVLFWMLRAPDGHAKNFSIQLLAGGHYRLTPLYDVMSALPVLGPGPNQWSEHRLKMAMALLGKSKHYAVSRIQRRQFNSTALRIGMGTDANSLIERILEQTPAVIAKVQAELSRDFSPRVAETVLGGLERAAGELAAMRP